MIFTPTPLAGACVIDIEPVSDARGLFARTVCTEQFQQHSLSAGFVQQSLAYNLQAGTLRGLHYQQAPYREDKLIRVTQGAAFDVVVDLRRESATFGRWFGLELSAENRRQLFVPAGFAHGYQTLLPKTELLYAMTAPFHRDAGRGIRWDDPQVAVAWPPADVRVLSDADRNLPFLSAVQTL